MRRHRAFELDLGLAMTIRRDNRAIRRATATVASAAIPRALLLRALALFGLSSLSLLGLLLLSRP